MQRGLAGANRVHPVATPRPPQREIFDVQLLPVGRCSDLQQSDAPSSARCFAPPHDKPP